MRRAWHALAILCVGAGVAYAQTGATGPAGTWRADGLQWTVELKVNGSAITGTVSDAGGFSAEIYDASIDGNTITFKARTATGDRTVTFIGKITGDEIAFTREVQIRPGANPGGISILGGGGPLEFTVRRRTAARPAEWSGTIRNAPNPRNPNPNPIPRPVTLGTKKLPDPHWRWRGGEKELEIRTFTLPMGSFDLNTFQLESDRLSYSFSRPNQGDEVRCSLTRQPGGRFDGTCQSNVGGFNVLIELTPPEAGKAPVPVPD